MAAFDGGVYPQARTSGNSVHYLGAAAALAIIAGIGVWSYDLIKRDVSGIPVVRAMEGEMRVLPDNPGGEVALHTGLAVNSVAAEGEAAELGDTLVLAPSTTELAEEDLVISPTAEAGEVIAADVSPQARPIDASANGVDIAAALEASGIEQLADELTAGVAPIEPLDDASVVPAVLSVDGAPAIEIISASIPGVTTSLRPVGRPQNNVVAELIQIVGTAPVATPAARPAVETPVVAAGTNLVQLGAYPTTEDADAAWVALQAQFGDYLVNKEQLVQGADSGGTTFYRLRAMGFEDLSAARRFCAALEAGNADCIPVVVR